LAGVAAYATFGCCCCVPSDRRPVREHRSLAVTAQQGRAVQRQIAMSILISARTMKTT
jgi:hypothetical protein